MELTPIGILHTPFATAEGVPIQPAFARECKGEAKIHEAYRAGLEGLEGFSHAWLIYGFHQQTKARLRVTPFMADHEMGVYATRSPARPNRLGLTLAQITGVTADSVQLQGVDMLDGTPLYDIKPYVPAFDVPEGEVHCGWLEDTAAEVVTARSDGRFIRRKVRTI